MLVRRLLWQGFPVLVSGRCASTGRFFPTHITLQSEEDTRAYANTYTFVKDTLGEAPRARMADAAKEITAAGEQVSVG